MIPCYIAGPLGAPTRAEMLANIERAEDVAKRLGAWGITRGILPVCPHSMARVFLDDEAGADARQAWVELGRDMAKRLPFMVVVRGWESSKGTLAEIERALQYNSFVFMADDGEPGAWLRYGSADAHPDRTLDYCVRLWNS